MSAAPAPPPRARPLLTRPPGTRSSMATVQSYYQNLWRAVQTGALSRAPASLVHSLRSLSSVQLAAGAVVAAECLGFFTVGEMLGRFKLVGYHGHTAHHH